MRTTLKLVGINLLIFGGIFVILELIFGNWLQRNPAKRLPELARQTGRTYQFKTHGLTGEDVEVNFTRDKEGLRGKRKESGDWRQILVLGGSTAIEFTLPEEKTWAEQLEKSLNQASDTSNFDVINAGITGQTLLDNKVAVETWLGKIKFLKPELVLIYYGYHDTVYTFNEAQNSKKAHHLRLKSFTENFLLNSGIATLGRELKGDYRNWIINNQHLFDYQPEKLPYEGNLYIVDLEGQLQKKRCSSYLNTPKQLIQAIRKTWPSTQIVFIAQSDPNCFFTSHDSYRAKEKRTQCEDLLTMHHFTANYINKLNSDKQSIKKIGYEPLFLDNPYDRSGASDHIHTNSRGSLGIAQKLAPRIQAYL